MRYLVYLNRLQSQDIRLLELSDLKEERKTGKEGEKREGGREREKLTSDVHIYKTRIRILADSGTDSGESGKLLPSSLHL